MFIFNSTPSNAFERCYEYIDWHSQQQTFLNINCHLDCDGCKLQRKNIS